MKKMNVKMNLSFNLSFLRKYSAMLLPIGIVVASGVVLAIVIMSGRDLKAQINQSSIRAGSDIRGRISSAPSRRQPEIEKTYQDLHEADAQAIENAAVQTTQRTLLSYKVFPSPQDSSHQIFVNFGRSFREYLEQSVQRLNAGDAPSMQEIRTEVGLGGPALGGSDYYGRGGRAALRGANAEAMLDAYCGRRAEQIRLYATPYQVPWYDFWDQYTFNGLDEALRDCWYTQVAQWIYDDVFTTIANLNGTSNTVYSSPVKRLVGVTFSYPADYVLSNRGGGRMGYEAEYARGYDAGGARGIGRGSGGDRPLYIREARVGPLGSYPWTGRVSNSEIDVVHFSVAVVVGSKSVKPFMEELCSEKAHEFLANYQADGRPQQLKHNQITILSSEVEPVELDAPEHEYYRYGPGAVVRLNLVCEYVFVRKGFAYKDASGETKDIQPDVIKVDLGLQEAEATSGAAGRGAAGGRYDYQDASGRSRSR